MRPVESTHTDVDNAIGHSFTVILRSANWLQLLGERFFIQWDRFFCFGIAGCQIAGLVG